VRKPARIAPQSCTQAYGPLPQHLENCTPLHGKLADVTCADAPLTTRGAGSARGGEILASGLVRELVEPRGEFTFGPKRMVTLKGLGETHAVHPVAWA
jgi:hypothetical protein